MRPSLWNKFQPIIDPSQAILRPTISCKRTRRKAPPLLSNLGPEPNLTSDFPSREDRRGKEGRDESSEKEGERPSSTFIDFEIALKAYEARKRKKEEKRFRARETFGLRRFSSSTYSVPLLVYKPSHKEAFSGRKIPRAFLEPLHNKKDSNSLSPVPSTSSLVERKKVEQETKRKNLSLSQALQFFSS